MGTIAREAEPSQQRRVAGEEAPPHPSIHVASTLHLGKKAKGEKGTPQSLQAKMPARRSQEKVSRKRLEVNNASAITTSRHHPTAECLTNPKEQGASATLMTPSGNKRGGKEK